MIKDYIITITIDEYDLPLEKISFTYWYALDEGDIISDLMDMAVVDCYKRLDTMGLKDFDNNDIVITPYMITIEEVK
jgi:hypothetical protein